MGANVWLLARRKELLILAKEELEHFRIDAEQHIQFVSADVTNEQEILAVVEEVASQAGSIDLLINSAGVVHPGKFQNLELAKFQWMMDVNYFGQVHTIKAVLPSMIARGSGHIVNISSLAAALGIYGYTAYAPSKFAVRGFSEALRAELKPLGIIVSLVLPPDTATPQLAYEKQYRPVETQAIAAFGKVHTAEQVAQAIIQGIARKKFLIIPGIDSKLIYIAIQLLGTAIFPILDWLIKRAQTRKTSE